MKIRLKAGFSLIRMGRRIFQMRQPLFFTKYSHRTGGSIWMAKEIESEKAEECRQKEPIWGTVTAE